MISNQNIAWEITRQEELSIPADLLCWQGRNSKGYLVTAIWEGSLMHGWQDLVEEGQFFYGTEGFRTEWEKLEEPLKVEIRRYYDTNPIKTVEEVRQIWTNTSISSP